MSIIVFIIILLVLVLVHEFGHFFTAKKFGIKVEEFGFGFPPKLFSFKKGETEYSFNLLPLGGFVKIFGENFEEADFVEVGFLEKDLAAKQDLARSFVYQAKWKQALVLVAGVAANFLLAWILFSFSFMTGLPTSAGSASKYQLENVNLVVTSVLEDSPAENAGLKIGDKIVSLQNGEKIVSEITPETTQYFVFQSEGKEIRIGYLRGKNPEIKYTQATPVLNDRKPGSYIIGISMDMIGTAKLPFFKAFWEGMKLDLLMTKNTAVGLYTLILEGFQGKNGLAAVTGPVGMVGIVGDAYQFGFVYLLSFAALISINLAIINLLPFPALDGGRLLFLLIEKIKGSRLNPKFANTANMIGFSLLIFLMLFITYHDIIKLF